MPVDRLYWPATLLVFLAQTSWQSVGQTAPVENITIESAWGGFGPSVPPLKLAVQRRNQSFVSDGEPVETELVEALVNALSAPVLPKPVSSNLGISKAWLDANVDSVTKIGGPSRYSLHFVHYWPLFQAGFTNLSRIDTVLPSLFQGFHTDDYPGIAVKITFSDGNSWSASSNSQYPFLLPWQVNARGARTITYDANLSKAIAALMPEKGVNRTRLRGQSFGRDLANALMQHLEAEWMNPALRVLRRHYDVRRAELDFRDSVDFGEAWKDAQPRQANMLAYLSRDSFPPFFQIAAVLPLHEGVVRGADEVQSLTTEHVERFSSIPWLLRFPVEKQTEVELRFVYGRSFSVKAMAVFDADMRALGKQSLANEVRALQDNVTLLLVRDQGYWLILPGNRMVLWRYDAPSGLLKWTVNDFSSSECVTYQQLAKRCVGAVISAAGEIVQQ